MKISILDRPEKTLDWSVFEELGEVRIFDRTDPETTVERIGDAEIVLLNSMPVTAEDLKKCPNVKFISIIATGYNMVDIKAAKEMGIPVSNIPTYGTGIIAQHAIALLLEVTNRVGYHDGEVRKGRRDSCKNWSFWDYPMVELEGKSLGIIGLGRIGQAVARIAQGFGMKILAFDSFRHRDLESDTLKYVDLDTLLTNSDMISLHCPLFPETENMINKDTIQKMKDGVIIINNSRGKLICEQDLADALNSGKVYGAGLDVVPIEPIPMDSPLLSAKNCIMTPHISWASQEARQKLIDQSYENVVQFLAGNPIHVINP